MARIRILLPLRRFTAPAHRGSTSAWHKGHMTPSEMHHPAETRRVPTRGRSLRPARADVFVAIVDPKGRADQVETYLPRRWSVRRFANIYEVDRSELMVVAEATPYLVAAARLLQPHVILVALIDAGSPARTLVDVLHSGADAAVRSGALHILASHLIAGHRRLARRVSVAQRAAR